MQGRKSAVGRTSATPGAVHKSTEWLRFVYLIKYHFIEMHGAWGWGRGLQRLWAVWGADVQMVHRPPRPTCSVVMAGILNLGFALLNGSQFRQIL